MQPRAGSTSTAGSVQCERQLEVAASLASIRVFAAKLQTLGARFGDEWAPARPGSERAFRRERAPAAPRVIGVIPMHRRGGARTPAGFLPAAVAPSIGRYEE